MRRRRFRVAPRLLALLLLAFATRASPAWADAPPPLDVSALRGGHSLTPHLRYLEDPEGKLTLDAVRTLPAARKRPLTREPAFGFTYSAVWLEFKTENPSDDARSWLLELAYPLLDEVTLYAVHADGRRERHVTGDLRPFSERALVHTNFVFRLDELPHASTSYYLRIRTQGALKAPLKAWTRATFLAHQQTYNIVLWVFYGAILVLALHSLGVFLMIRQREYLIYVMCMLFLWSISFTLSGHTAQHLLPDHPEWANRAIPICVGLALAWAFRFAQSVTGRVRELDHLKPVYLVATSGAVAVAIVACFAPLGVALRITLAAAALSALLALVHLYKIVRHRVPHLRLYLISWSCLIVALPVQVLRQADLLPASFLTDWAAHLGGVLHGIFTSLALASRVGLMTADLGRLNTQLSANVSDLKLALARAEHATEQARAATKAKDEFVATMSHELRTPLNAIINVPQGLLEDFTELATATCGACEAKFVLEPGDVLDAETSCDACGAAGKLVAGREIRYVGDAAQTSRFLRRIERSGKHLLQMVNGVLDHSRLEAGQLELSRGPVDLGALLRDVADELSDLAERRSLSITLELSEPLLPTVADGLRIKQVVINLLANAIKFSEPGTTITVRWRAEPEADLIAVSDRGIGIEPEHHARIFERFEQVHTGDTRKYGGTGLGLSISRRLVRMHGGELRVASAPGEGSTFSFDLPRAGVALAPLEGAAA